MIELTPAEKAQVFAMYIGCEVKYPDTDGKKIVAKLDGVSLSDGITTTYKRKIKGCSGDILSWKGNSYHNSDALNCKLLLTNLSDITDEHAISVTKILHSIRGTQDQHIKFGRDVVEKHFLDGILPMNGIEWLKITDYLRSQGYDLPVYISPNHPDNGKTPIELGLAIAKTK